MLIDTHCHINSLADDRIDELRAISPEDKIFVDVSIDPHSSERSLALAGSMPCVYSCLGFHPFSIDQYQEKTAEKYAGYIRNNSKVIGIGEVGLDCTASFAMEDQVKILEKFIDLAGQNQLPLAIHNRLNSFLIFEVLDRFMKTYDKVVFHCFSQDSEFLRRIIDKNGMVSFSLNILRRKKKIVDALQEIPLDNLILETDSPYMRIEGQPSHPLDIEKVYEFVSREKDLERAALEKKIRENVSRIFRIQAEDRK